MLFNSFDFLFLFLPLTLLCTYVAARLLEPRLVITVLIAASLVFYAYSSIVYLGLFAVLMVANYALGLAIASKRTQLPEKRLLLALGCSLNLGVLAYFKYRAFLAANLNDAFHLGFKLESLIVPLGISFFIFQKIAFLVDVYRGRIQRLNFQNYVLFVSFFPQLIAGPIVHYGEMQPQFDRNPWSNVAASDVIRGISFITIGLFKKVALADNFSGYAEVVFKAADGGMAPSFSDAWIGCVAFGLQIYFDFSGYTDIAIGLAALFGIHLPVNFASPYKARSIIEFWRRWHITLSRFLRDYLYIPLGGNRKGGTRRYANLMITMALGGLWHGAAWTFVAWGVLHGTLLSLNHLWRHLCAKFVPLRQLSEHPAARPAAWALTFVAVMMSWAFFRAPSFAAAMKVSGAMLHVASGTSANLGWREFLFVAGGVVWVVLLPNSQEVVHRILALPDRSLPLVGLGQGIVFACSMYFMMAHQYEKFIYFMF